MAGLLPVRSHGSAEKKQARQEAVKHPAKTQQSLEEMSVILSDAYANGKRVSIQVNDRDLNGEFRPDLVGKVIGYKEDKIYLAGQTDVSILDMRHVERGIGM